MQSVCTSTIQSNHNLVSIDIDHDNFEAVSHYSDRRLAKDWLRREQVPCQPLVTHTAGTTHLYDGLDASRDSPSDYFQWFDNLIIELKDVFLVPPTVNKYLKSIVYEVTGSAAWFDFQKGRINRQECQRHIADKLAISEGAVRGAIEASSSHTAAVEIIALMHDLRKSHRLFAVGNISSPDLYTLESKLGLLSIFDDVYTSSRFDERLPFPGFFDSVIIPRGTIDPQRTLYISADLDNTVTARSLGFHGLQFQVVASTCRIARCITSNPLIRARAFLRSSAGNLDLTTDLGHTLKDNFAQFIILDATKDPSLVHSSLLPPNKPPLFSFLYAPPPKGMTPFLPDIDTNSFAFSTLPALGITAAHTLMDTMLRFRSRTGLLETYLTLDRIRLDATACVNALALFHAFGRGHQVCQTEDWVLAVLRTRAYSAGTRYYPTGDFFLYFISRLLLLAPHLNTRFAAPFRDCVRETAGLPGDALALALRVVCMVRACVRCERALEQLLSLQLEDGSWGDGCCYQFAREKCRCFHRGLTVAVAVLAIREWAVWREEGWREG